MAESKVFAFPQRAISSADAGLIARVFQRTGPFVKGLGVTDIPTLTDLLISKTPGEPHWAFFIFPRDKCLISLMIA